MANTYNENDTMKLLGYQYIMEIMCNEKVREDMGNIAKARPGESSRDMAYDCFMLGYIYGKRAERRKKRATLAKN